MGVIVEAVGRAHRQVVTEWEVYLADGSILSSRTHSWDQVPTGILVVRWQRGNQKGIHWGDSYYGKPDTWKACAVVDDELFQQIFAAAQRAPWPLGST